MSLQRRTLRLRERLGSGTFGEVFLADLETGAGFRRRVAVKVLHERHLGHKEAVARLRDEARLLGQISHRHIVGVIDLQVVGGRWMILMEHVPGVDLEQLYLALRNCGEELPVRAALGLGGSIASALDAALYTPSPTGAPLRVVHRDIKPANIRLRPDGDVKVLDFGVASMQMEGRESRTGIVVGTPNYMSPERISGLEDGPSGDIFGLSLLLVEGITGLPASQTPVLPESHRQWREVWLTVVRAHLQGPGEAVEGIIDLLRRGLSGEPAERPSAAEMERELLQGTRALEGEGLRSFAKRWVPELEAELARSRAAVDKALVLSDHTLGFHPTPSHPPISAMIRSPAETHFVELPATDSVSPTLVPTDHSLPSSLGAVHSPLGGSGSPSAGHSSHLKSTASLEPLHGQWVRGIPRRILTIFAVGAAGLLGLWTAKVAWTPFGTGEGFATPKVARLPGPTPQPENLTPVLVPVASADETSILEDGGVETQRISALAQTPETAAEMVTSPSPEPESEAPARLKARSRIAAAPEDTRPVHTGPTQTVSRALVVTRGSDSLHVACGGVREQGTASVRIIRFPAGLCTVQARFGSELLEATVQIDSPREVSCGLREGLLACY